MNDTTGLQKLILNKLISDSEMIEYIDLIKSEDFEQNNNNHRDWIFSKIKKSYESDKTQLSKDSLYHFVDLEFDNEYDSKKIRVIKNEINMICNINSVETPDFVIKELRKARASNALDTVLEESYLELDKGNYEEALLKLTNFMDNKPKIAMKEIPPLSAFVDECYAQYGDGTKRIRGLKTNFEPYDKNLNGIDGLTLISAAPGCGKTALCLQLACGVAANKIPVLYYSLEMDRIQLVSRNLSRESEVEYDTVYDYGRIYLDSNYQGLTRPDADIQKKLDAGNKITREMYQFLTVFTHEDERQISFETLRSDIRTTKEKYGVEKVLVVIDCLQIFPTSERFGNSIDKENHLMSNFKKLHSVTKCPIVLISHQNKMAISSGKGGLEVVKGSVDNIYTPDTVISMVDHNKNTPDYVDEWRPITVYVNKNRNGKSNFAFTIDFCGKYTKFAESKGGN